MNLFSEKIKSRSQARARGEYRRFERVRRGLCFAQDDLSVANASGATVRADLNANLQALGSLMSGASAPGTTYAHMLWADTTSGTLKKRNAANSGWIVVRTIDETFVLARSSNTILDVSDIGKTIRATASFTQTLDAAATLADGWWVNYRIESGATVTFDPNSTEEINGATTLAITGPASGIIACNGTALYTVGLARVADLSAETAPAVDDLLHIYDLSAAADEKMAFSDYLKVINGLTEDVTPDSSNDFVAIYDASASAAKKVKLSFLGSGLKKLASGSVSAAATLDIVLSAYTGYKTLLLKLERWLPVTDDVQLWLRMSTDGGSTFAASSGDYRHQYFQYTLGTFGESSNTATGTQIVLAGGAAQVRGQGNAATEELMGLIYIGERTNTTAYKNVHGHVTFGDGQATSDQAIGTFGGARRATADVDAIRLLYESGNIASGDWTLYGIED